MSHARLATRRSRSADPPGGLRLRRGTTLQNLIDRIRARRLAARSFKCREPAADRGDRTRAEAAGIPLALANHNARSRQRSSASRFSGRSATAGADLVILGGFLALLKIPPDYKGRVINVHPSLIPAFCGKGFYGSGAQGGAGRGVKFSGCTVHFADDAYDTGPIIFQRTVPVLDDDTVETLAARVFQEECKALPEAIALYAAAGSGSTAGASSSARRGNRVTWSR